MKDCLIALAVYVLTMAVIITLITPLLYLQSRWMEDWCAEKNGQLSVGYFYDTKCVLPAESEAK